MRDTGDFERRVSSSIQASIAVKELLLRNAEVVSIIAKVSQLLVDTLDKGYKVLLFGNGGSAADAQHIAAEFVGRFAFDRPALPALALSVNTSCVTAIGNDYGFDQVFSRQIEALARPGDMAIGISTSGNSPNVLHGLSAAQQNRFVHSCIDRLHRRETQERGRPLHLCTVKRHTAYPGMPHFDRPRHFAAGGRDDIP